MADYFESRDGSVVASDARILVFSQEQFIRDIVEGECCFLCGVAESTADFNREHVLPRWLLKRYGLFDERITLPNGTRHTYRSYTIPCCVGCNSLLGKRLEKPMREVLTSGFDAVNEEVRVHGPCRLFIWLNLIYLKIHLKDTLLRLEQRSLTPKIGSIYRWESMHHVHCIVRAVLGHVTLEDSVCGSLLVLPMQENDSFGNFDYADMYQVSTVYLRMGNVALVAVLNDARAASSVMRGALGTISALNGIQGRELMVRMGDINGRLKERPQFGTRVGDEGLVVAAARPSGAIELEEGQPEEFGRMLEFYLGSYLEYVVLPAEKDVRKAIAGGRVSFLFDQSGGFNHANR